MTVAEDVFSDLPTLETPRLLLRKLAAADAQSVFDYASDPEVARHATFDPHRSIEDAHAFVARTREAYGAGDIAPWGVVHRGDGRLIGTCGFVYWSALNARAELGYALSRRYWGRGLMTEAVHTVIAFGFNRMRLNRVEARCLPLNVGSARVMEKCGMQFEGLLRQYIYVKGEYHDMKMYSILREEWERDLPPPSQ